MKTSVYIRDIHSTYITHKIGKCPHFGKKKSTCIMLFYVIYSSVTCVVCIILTKLILYDRSGSVCVVWGGGET